MKKETINPDETWWKNKPGKNDSIMGMLNSNKAKNMGKGFEKGFDKAKDGILHGIANWKKTHTVTAQIEATKAMIEDEQRRQELFRLQDELIELRKKNKKPYPRIPNPFKPKEPREDDF
jgi:hypothetical protein